jgi:hypothetical protein
MLGDQEPLSKDIPPIGKQARCTMILEAMIWYDMMSWGILGTKLGYDKGHQRSWETKTVRVLGFGHLVQKLCMLEVQICLAMIWS